MLRAVLDANVFVSAAIRPEGPPGEILRRFVRDDAFEIVLSPSLIEETFRALSYPKVRRCIRGALRVEEWFEDIVVLAVLVAGETIVRGIGPDPDDDRYLAAALEGRAPYVVTGDRGLLSVVEHAGVLVIPPRRFLEALR